MRCRREIERYHRGDFEASDRCKDSQGGTVLRQVAKVGLDRSFNNLRFAMAPILVKTGASTRDLRYRLPGDQCSDGTRRRSIADAHFTDCDEILLPLVSEV